MRRVVFASLIGTIPLAACATKAAPTDAPAFAQAPAQGPGGLAWALTPAAGSDEAKLAYGVPDSEGVVVMLTCRPGSGQVAVTTPKERAAQRPVLVLKSDDATSRLAARAEPSEITPGVLVEATAPATDPALTGFARTGEFAFEVDGLPTALPDADPQQARRFLDSCRP